MGNHLAVNVILLTMIFCMVRFHDRNLTIFVTVRRLTAFIL